MSQDSQDGRPSQSLFQVYYLGASMVDRRCSSSVMPWIVEEHKLKTQEMNLLWLTPGTYVRDGIYLIALFVLYFCFEMVTTQLLVCIAGKLGGKFKFNYKNPAQTANIIL